MDVSHHSTGTRGPNSRNSGPTNKIQSSSVMMGGGGVGGEGDRCQKSILRIVSGRPAAQVRTHESCGQPRSSARLRALYVCTHARTAFEIPLRTKIQQKFRTAGSVSHMASDPQNTDIGTAFILRHIKTRIKQHACMKLTSQRRHRTSKSEKWWCDPGCALRLASPWFDPPLPSPTFPP